MTGRLARWAPAALWAVLLFLTSSRQTLPVGLDSGLDKLAHFFAYLVLGFLTAYAVRSSRWPLWVAVVIGATYGVVDELHQSTVPGRYAEVNDWLADVAGTAAGVLLFLILTRRRSAGPGSGRPNPSDVVHT